MIEHLPPDASVLIMTRADPALHLGRLRAARQLAEIRADRLAFDRDEAEALLRIEDIQLSAVALSELMQRTEGWPAGLYLATMSLIGREDPDAFVHQFSGDNRYIGDYLIEEVLSRETQDVRAFILEVSIFERFSASLCEFVLQMPHAGRIMHDLERSNLFLVPLDASRQWFRFHHLFAAVARSELEAEDPALVTRLHERAADWFRVARVRRRSRRARRLRRLDRSGLAARPSQLDPLRRCGSRGHGGGLAERPTGPRAGVRPGGGGDRSLDGPRSG